MKINGKCSAIGMALVLGMALGMSSGASAQRQASAQRPASSRPQKAVRQTADDRSAQEREALSFLYDYMPLGDRADYDSAFYVANVCSAFQARAEMPWGKSVPEREFRHFVLPVRVNNENLDSARQVFYRELKPRVQHLSMYEAVLEVNHWCHEKAVYTPSDARTSSPLATVKTAYGRCGEESVFLVAALRSVGIPARQVYTPRWAHTDDNHAWVEAWVDGTWYFLGACEPEPVLNLAWFNEPASRGMLMHTKVFGAYDGPEEVIGRTPCYTEINVIGQYAPVGKLKVRVLDEAGEPVAGARTDYKLYNYAEFFTVASFVTDGRGETALTAGRGDMLVWAAKGDRFGFAKVSFGRDSLVEIVLTRRVGDEFALDFDMEPPVASAQAVTVPPAQRAENDRRLQAEDAVRNAYTATFATEATAWSQLDFLQDSALRAQAADFLVRGRGNHAVLRDFLGAVPAAEAAKAVRLLSVVSDKDLRDIEPEVLRDHFAHTAPYVQAIGEAAWARYVLNPRVRYERLTPYKHYFQENLPDTLKTRVCDDPVWFAAWCLDNIRLQPERNPQRVPVTPVGVWRSRTADPESLRIFYVSVLRSMGIPARLHEVTGKTQYMDGAGHWREVNFGEAVARRPVQGLLWLGYTGTQPKDPVYYTHFTLSHYNGAAFDLLTFDESRETTWRNYFEAGQMVDTGYYLLCSGSRLAQGGVLTHLRAFNVPAGDTLTQPLIVRRDAGRVGVVGAFDAESKYVPLAATKPASDASAASMAGAARSVLQAMGRGFYVLGILGPGQEPTDHALRDVTAVAAELEAVGRPMLLLCRDEADWRRFEAGAWHKLPAQTQYGLDKGGAIEAALRENLDLESAQLPIWIVADTFNRVVWFSRGYTIGLGEQLLKVLQSLAAPSPDTAR